MQLELGATIGSGGRVAGAAPCPRVVAAHVPDVGLQRMLRHREGARSSPHAPLAIERNGTVVACDAEARAAGIRPGDRVVQACAASADLVVFAADEQADLGVLEAFAEALLAIAPAVEIAPPDALLLDASGAHLLGDVDGEGALADRAVALATELGLRCRTAVASGRAPARALAAHGRAAGPIAPDDTARALAPLPIEALGLGPGLAARLAALGLRTIGDLARMPGETLGHRLGAQGLTAWRIARGDDPSPLVPFVPATLPQECVELDAPVERVEPLLFALKRTCDRAALRLAGRGLGATRLSLRFRLDPAGEERLEVAFAGASSAASRWLLVLRERLAALRLPGAVVAVALAVVEAGPASVEQLAIDDRPRQLVAIETVLERLEARLGKEALFAARAADRYRPERAYAPAAFLPNPGRSRTPTGRSRTQGHVRGRRGTAAQQGSGEEGAAADAVRPTRLLPRPQPLVALGEGGRLAAVRLGRETLRVLSLSAAERLAGEWWSDPFDRDYHRARLEGLGECWVFRDARDGRLWLHGFFD
jgi:protein ImuB